MTRRIAGSYLLPAGTLLGLMLTWEFSMRVFNVPRFLIPLPSGILLETWEWRYRLPEHIWTTLVEVLAAFGLAIAIGIPLAVLLVYSRLLGNAVFPLLVLLQSTPKIAIAPILLLLIGHGLAPKIFVAFLGAFFPVVVATHAGLAGTPHELMELTRSYRAPALRTFIKARFPWALPFVFSGLKVAITFAVTGAVVAEFVGSDVGLGYLILAATSFWNANLAFAAIILLAVMAIILYGSVSLAERILCPWYVRGTDLE